VINSSDVPGGVVNILTGKPSELFSQFASHMDVNAVVYCGNDELIEKRNTAKSGRKRKKGFALQRRELVE
jgi:acyl-CoA reductase-like NAD-dependent aldehyde dehydrogenase